MNKQFWIVLTVILAVVIAFGFTRFLNAPKDNLSVTEEINEGTDGQEKARDGNPLLSELEAVTTSPGSILEIRERATQLHAEILSQFPDSPMSRKADQMIEDFSVRVLFSPSATEDSISYQVQPGDNLTSIARRHRTTVELIMRSNGLPNDLIRAGQSLKVVPVDYSILVDKSENRLWLMRGGETFKTYTISTGRDGITPVGEFEVTDKLIDPTWYKSGAVIAPGSPKNILGSRWLGIGIPGYGIHGTTQPDELGKEVTNGCVRMSNSSVEELFAIVPPGTKVVIVD
jgi:lipoprotein-anchoring transpeptidase ErfK/SrfK